MHPSQICMSILSASHDLTGTAQTPKTCLKQAIEVKRELEIGKYSAAALHLKLSTSLKFKGCRRFHHVLISCFGLGRAAFDCKALNSKRKHFRRESYVDVEKWHVVPNAPSPYAFQLLRWEFLHIYVE